MADEKTQWRETTITVPVDQRDESPLVLRVHLGGGETESGERFDMYQSGASVLLDFENGEHYRINLEAFAGAVEAYRMGNA